MVFLRQWLLGVIACAMLVSLLGQVCPDGSVRRAARFAGGLLLLLAMLRPLAGIDPGGLDWDAGGYREAVAQLELELSGSRETALAGGIASGLAAYIEDKAESLGANVRAEVQMKSEDGTYTPDAVTLRGAYNEALAVYIADVLGIPKEKQTWIEDE